MIRIQNTTYSSVYLKQFFFKIPWNRVSNFIACTQLCKHEEEEKTKAFSKLKFLFINLYTANIHKLQISFEYLKRNKESEKKIENNESQRYDSTFLHLQLLLRMLGESTWKKNIPYEQNKVSIFSYKIDQIQDFFLKFD